MENLNDLIKKYSINYDQKIKKICDPLKMLGIPYFAYYSIGNDGKLNIISNYPEHLDFFYSEKLYLDHPFLCHPSLFRSGYSFTQAVIDPAFLEVSKAKYHIDHLFIKFEHTEEGMECFGFATDFLRPRPRKINVFLSLIDSFESFAKYFKRECQSLIKKSRDDNYNLLEAKGQNFYHSDPTLHLSSQRSQIPQFLKEISILSEREEECLKLFKKGKSAQATAAILGLSKRTVEHYFESVKNKLGCNSKWDLLNK